MALKAALKGIIRGLVIKIGALGYIVNIIKLKPVEFDILKNILKDLVKLERTIILMEHRIGKTEDISLIIR